MNLENRIKRRLLMEPPLAWDNATGHIPETARIAALEAEHPANLLAQTAVVRKDACDTTGPDLDAFAAAFQRATQEQS